MKHIGPRKPHRPLSAIFGAPILIALASIVGLVAALIGNDLWHVVSWLTLGTPVAVLYFCLRCRRMTNTHRDLSLK